MPVPWTLLLLIVLLAPVAHSDPKSEFEEDVVNEVFAQRKLVPDDAAYGKWVESVEVVVLDVFDERDPVPKLFNVLHVSSRDYVVKRELSFGQGEVLTPQQVDDSLANLRNTGKFSLVLIEEAKGSYPDRIRVVVIVKDVWSLRLNWDAEVANGRVDLLLLNPSEINLFGTHTTLGLYYMLQRDRHTAGGIYVDRHVGSSNLYLGLTSGVILERESGDPEGNYGTLVYYQPQKSRRDTWAWSVGTAWLNEVTRFYEGDGYRPFTVVHSDGEEESIPQIYETDRLTGEYQLIRSFGTAMKTDLTVGAEADRRRYRAPDLGAYSPAAAEAFEENVLPVSDVRISPFFEIRAYDTDVHRVLNFETLALQEDLQLGHDVLLRVYPASRSVGSSRSLIGVVSALEYSVPLGTGLARAEATSTIELANQNKNNVEFELGARLATPSLGPGRFHLNGIAVRRVRNYLNLSPYALGGDNRLRGYPVQAFAGDDVVAANAEFRSVSVEVLGVHLAGTVFYDAGAVGDGGELQSGLKHSLGAGVRMLFPQFDRVPLRIDWGFPLSADYATFPGAFYLTFGQAFGLPAISSPSVLSGLVPD